MTALPVTASLAAPRPPGGWRRLRPLTRLVVGVGTLVAAVVLESLACLLVLAVAAVAVPAVTARIGGSVLRTSTLLSLPLIVSVTLVNVFLLPGAGEPILRLGPLTATAEGATLAAVVLVRVLTMAGAATLFYRTMSPGELALDLEARGLSRRLTLVVQQAVSTVPRMAERAADVTAAQRARGLETERGIVGRLRGVLAISAPTIIGALEEAEVRTIALESRGFGRPGRRTVLEEPEPEPIAERAIRWLVVAAVVALVSARLAGVGLPC